MFESYVRAGFDVMNQANNPNTYHGHEPLMRSFQVLDAAGIIHSGAGPNLAEARKPGIIERNGTKIAFVSRTSVGTPGMEATVDTPGVAFYPVQTLYEPPARVHSNPGLLPIVHTVPDRGEHLSALEEDIRAAREQADVVIVSWHWGLSPYQIQPNAGAGELPVMEYQQEMGTSPSTPAPTWSSGITRTSPSPSRCTRANPSSIPWPTSYMTWEGSENAP